MEKKREKELRRKRDLPTGEKIASLIFLLLPIFLLDKPRERERERERERIWERKLAEIERETEREREGMKFKCELNVRGGLYLYWNGQPRLLQNDRI